MGRIVEKLMTSARWRLGGFVAWGLGAYLAVVLCGCGGGFGSSTVVQVPAEQRQILDASAFGKTILLPKQQPLNIHLKQSSQNPGPGGKARGAAEANGWGDASCSAVVGDGGAAAGEFHIGQAMDYAGDVPSKANVKVSLKLLYELAAEPVAPANTAQLGITVLVRDSSGHVSAKVVLANLSSDDAPGKAVVTDSREVSLTMYPHESYQVVVVGVVNAASGLQGAATARVELKNLEIALSLAPVPTTTSAPSTR